MIARIRRAPPTPPGGHAASAAGPGGAAGFEGFPTWPRIAFGESLRRGGGATHAQRADLRYDTAGGSHGKTADNPIEAAAVCEE